MFVFKLIPAGLALLVLGVHYLRDGRPGLVIACVGAVGLRLAGASTMLADVAGKISPFRIRIGEECTSCGKCSKVCRYDALSSSDIESKRPAFSCSLCGDCVGACQDSQIGYRFPGLPPERARTVFVVLAAALHAAFLGVARM